MSEMQLKELHSRHSLSRNVSSSSSSSSSAENRARTGNSCVRSNDTRRGVRVCHLTFHVLLARAALAERWIRTYSSVCNFVKTRFLFTFFFPPRETDDRRRHKGSRVRPAWETDATSGSFRPAEQCRLRKPARNPYCWCGWRKFAIA